MLSPTIILAALALGSSARMVTQPRQAAAPAPSNVAGDAPYSTSENVLQGAITCPRGIQNKPGGIVFLVHGTATNAEDTWKNGPYDELLPTAGPRYDICWVDLPNKGLADIQLSAEYVAYGIRYLAPQSTTGKVFVVGHSQGGGLNTQWAYTFWPSIKNSVAGHIALAGDFKGTTSGTRLCNAFKSSCPATMWQQTAGSKYLAAQNSPVSGSGATARVTTTSIYTTNDMIVSPQSPASQASSNLAGSTVFVLQQACNTMRLIDHFNILSEPTAYGLVLDALTHGGTASLSRLDPDYCLARKGVSSNFGNTSAQFRLAMKTMSTVSAGPNVSKEPTLQPYVCARGFATNCGPAFQSA